MLTQQRTVHLSSVRKYTFNRTISIQRIRSLSNDISNAFQGTCIEIYLARSRPWPFRVKWCHRTRDYPPIRHMPFPIGVPLEPSLYLQPFSRYSRPRAVRTQGNTDTRRKWFYILFHAMHWTDKLRTRPSGRYDTRPSVIKRGIFTSDMYIDMCRMGHWSLWSWFDVNRSSFDE